MSYHDNNDIESNVELSNVQVSNANVESNSGIVSTDSTALSFLPEVFQTEKLKNFFDGTVEQVLRKPNDEKTTEYIGRKTDVYFDSSKDNYKIEKTKNRQNYQLEPGIVLKDNDSGETTNAIFYNEILDHIDHENGIVSNQNRLFNQKYYSFSPPIDYDKFVNYDNYYWYPSQDLNVPSIVVDGTTENFTANNSQTTFTLESAITETIIQKFVETDKNNSLSDTANIVFNLSNYFNSDTDIVKLDGSVFTSYTANNTNKTITFSTGDIDSNSIVEVFYITDVIKVNGITVDYDNYTALGKTLVLSTASSANDVVEISHNVRPDLILGNKEYVSPNNIKFSSGMLIKFNDAYLIDIQGQYQSQKFFVEGVNSASGIEFVELSTEPELFLADELLPWDSADSIGLADENGGWDSARWSSVSDITNPDYITIERGSRDNNPWSRTNGWIHKDNLTNYRTLQQTVNVFHPWDAVTDDIRGFDTGFWDVTTDTQETTFQLDNSRKGRRPIIEFEKNIKLYNYGTQHAVTVDVLADDDTVDDINGSSTYTVDGINIEDDMLILFRNSDFETTLVPWSGDAYPWDHDSDANVATGGPTGGDQGWDITGADFDVSSSVWQVTGHSTGNIQLVKYNNIATDFNISDGSKITVRLGTTYQGKEYYWDGFSWIESQAKDSINSAPLFDIYNNAGELISDGSPEAGNKIFGYEVGTGSNDPYLKFPLTYENYNTVGDIKFKNHLADANSTHGHLNYKKYIYKNKLQDTFYYTVIVHPSKRNTGNKYFIDNIEQQNLVFIKGNKYVLDLSDSSFSATGFSGLNHQFALSETPDGRWNSGTRYDTNVKYFIDDVQVLPADFYNSFASAEKRRIEFLPDQETPDQLYYYCVHHENMGGEIRTVENNISSLVDATVIEYQNEWVLKKEKSYQKVIQEFIVDSESNKNTFVLDATIAGDAVAKVYVNNKQLEYKVDYTISKNQIINTTNNISEGSHVLVKWQTLENKQLKSAYYEIPKNLSNNPQNKSVISYSFSDYLSHFYSTISNQSNLVGLASENNSYRDTQKDISQGDVILQHTAPLMKAGVHVNSLSRDLIKSIKLAQTDYTKFKNQFVTKAQSIIDSSDTSVLTDSELVDTILKEMNANKKATSKWSHSLMLAYGDTKQTQSITIDSTNKTWNTFSQGLPQVFVQDAQGFHQQSGEPGLEIDFRFDPATEKQTKSLYIYQNNKQLLMNHDYILDNSNSTTSIVFIADIRPDIGDVIRIEYFADKQPAWIPATPAKLGMTGLYKPEQTVDNGHAETTFYFIQGHDGSLTLNYGNDIDRALLELEKRIYNDCENKFIDPDYVPALSYQTLVSNYFNKKDYSYKDYTNIIRSQMHSWFVFNKVDWELNDSTNNNWRAWNWSSVANLEGDRTPGHWRGIFKKFYGTEKPHTHPWEMLGFTTKPLWWDRNYSWTSFTKRQKLINDIENGIIIAGERENLSDLSYTDKNNPYRHENFSSFVPVDISGNVLNPWAIGLCNKLPQGTNTELSWRIGDLSPAELAFYRNSAYPFALVSTIALMKPAEFFELFFDTLNSATATINKNNVYDKNTNLRQSNNVKVHRELDNSSVVVGTGYQQYISENIINNSSNVEINYGNIIRNSVPQLIHKQSAFIDFGSYKAQAESYSPTAQRTSVFIPTDDIDHLTHVSTPIQGSSYSAVVIEKTIHGYRVSGYDIGKNYFESTVSDINGLSVSVNIGGTPINIPSYTPNQTVAVDSFVRYEGAVYKATQPHVTGDIFEPKYYQSVKNIPITGGASATYYKQIKNNKVAKIEYGTEFKTIQEVFDFLVNYGRKLESDGWIFDEYLKEQNETSNWLYAAKEFLFWSLGSWSNGSLLTLSPSANRIKFKPKSGVVSSVEDVVGNTYSILDKNGAPVPAEDTQILRDGSQITIRHYNKTPLYFVNLYARELEHITVFNNTTTFGDKIFDPILAVRQPRLKQTLLRTKDWYGKYEANGFIIDSNAGIISNFETSTRDMTRYLDVDKPINNEILNETGLHTIGYQNRENLKNLEILDENQTKFYQGFIRQKGTENSIDKLLRSDVISDRQDINLYEYYAFKIAEFGGSGVNQSIEFKLDSTKIKNNPQLISFLPTSDSVVTTDVETDNIITIDVDDTENWIKKPDGDKTTTDLFSVRSEKFEMPTAGYVHVKDTTYQVFDKSNLNLHYQTNANSNIQLGSTYWIAYDNNRDWNVYRLSNLSQSIDGIVSADPLTVTVDDSTGNLISNVGETVDVVIPKHTDSNSNVVLDMVHGSKTLTLVESDQTISKTFALTDLLGSGADVTASGTADQVQKFIVKSGGTGYSAGDTVTVAGSGGSSAVGNVATVDANTGAITSITLSSGGAGFYAEPTDISILTGNTASAGANAVIRLKGNNPTYYAVGTLADTNTFVNGETVTDNLGNTATLLNTFTGAGITHLLLTNESGSSFGTATYIAGATANLSTISNVTTLPSANISDTDYDDFDKTFGGLLSLQVNAGGSGYINPNVEFNDTANSNVAGEVITANGSVTSAYITDPGYGFQQVLGTEATLAVEVLDRVDSANAVTLDFDDKLIKCSTISNIAVTVNNEFDTTNNGSARINVTDSANITFASNIDLTANTVTTALSNNLTDRSTSNVQLEFYLDAGTSASEGNVTVSLNYKKITYSVADTTGNSATANTVVDSYFNSSSHPLYFYKDVRLASRNNGIDQSNVGSNLSATVNDFVSNVCSDITFIEGDKIWLDNGGNNNWYTLTMTSNASVKTAYDNLATNANIETSITVGSDYWIIHSDVNYDSIESSVFESTARTNKNKSQINSNLFYRSKVVDVENRSRQTDFEIWDPIKRLFPGEAEREIKFISSVDPAVYTNSSDPNRDVDVTAWGQENVGRVWWNTSTVKYLEYENYNLDYKQQYWGKTFPGSTFGVYEWTESTQTPEKYTGSGTPINNTDYSTVSTTNKQNITTVKYYFWVKNSDIVPNVNWRSLTTTAIARLLKNPTSYGVDWYAPVDTNSLLVANSSRYIGDQSNFRLNYKTKDVDIPTNSQWLMIKQNDPNKKVDERIWNKFTDSLSGQNSQGLAVPDVSNLSELNRYGNSLRPRQSWFKDVLEARKNFVYTANKILANINLDVDLPEWQQTVSTELSFNKIDYFASGYNSSIVIDREVDTYNDMLSATLTPGEVIKVDLDYNNKWAIYIYGNRQQILGTDVATSGNELVRIANQTATVELNSTFYTSTDSNVQAEIREIMSTMYSYIFAGSRNVYLNTLLFSGINTVFSQHNEIDWLIKTTYFDVVQEDQSLSQLVSYQPDTFTYLKDYINEAKPYHSKLINYLSKKTTPVEYANTSVVDTLSFAQTLVFDRTTKDIELLSNTAATDADQLLELKNKSQLTYPPDNSAIERIGKYFYADELNALDTSNTSAVESFMSMLRDKIAPFRDADFDANTFVTTGNPEWYQSLLQSTNSWQANVNYTPNVEIDSNSLITTNTMINYSNTDHFDSWSASANYNVGDIAKHEGLVYKCNVKHNSAIDQSAVLKISSIINGSPTIITTDQPHGLTNESVVTIAGADGNGISGIDGDYYALVQDQKSFALYTWQGYVDKSYSENDTSTSAYSTYPLAAFDSSSLGSYTGTTATVQGAEAFDFSKWDLVQDFVYLAVEDHTSNNFATDYSDGKWQLITTQLDSAGFVRPQHENYPEEFIPTVAKETLMITVVTYENTATDLDDIDSDSVTDEQHGYGDQYAFRIFYSNDSKTQYKRLPMVCQTELTAPVTNQSKEIRVANADVLYDSVAVLDPDDSNTVIGNIDAVLTGSVSDSNPGYIWIDQELIEYREVDGNTLKKIRRGVLGTSIQNHSISTVIHSASSQHDIPNAKESAIWSAYDSLGTTLIDKTVQSVWDSSLFAFDDGPWDKATRDPSEQAEFIRAGGISAFNLYNTTYVEPGYVENQAGTGGYFNEE